MSALSKPEPSRSLQVEILDLRHFSSVDLRPLLEGVAVKKRKPRKSASE